METDPKDLCRGMAPSETMKKVSAIDPMGLLGDHTDNDQEMREVEDIGGTSDADPMLHKNVHVISASEGEGSEGGIQGDGSEPTLPTFSTVPAATTERPEIRRKLSELLILKSRLLFLRSPSRPPS
jgi:hypothetical protein